MNIQLFIRLVSRKGPKIRYGTHHLYALILVMPADLHHLSLTENMLVNNNEINFLLCRNACAALVREKVELICFFLTHSPCSKFKRNRKENSTKNPYHHQMRQEFIFSPGAFKHLGDMIYRPTSSRKVSMVFPVAA